jgi:hypothetical protein
MENSKQKVNPDSLLARVNQRKEAVGKALKDVPYEILVNPETKVLDAAMGGGHYLAEVLRLRVEAGVPPEKAAKTLYGCESSLVYLNHAKWKLNLQNVNLAILKVSQLSKLGMKFDVILGNPPYQDANNKAKDQKLWMKFVQAYFNLLKDGGYMSILTPNSLVGKTKIPAALRKRFTSDFSLLSMDHTANDYFKVSVSIAQWLAVKTPYQGVTKVKDHKGSREIDLRVELPVPSEKIHTQALSEKIHEAVRSGVLPTLSTDLATPNLPASDTGTYKTYVSGRNKFYMADSPTLDNGKWKTVFSYSATYKQWFVTQDNVCGSHRLVFVETPEEGVEVGEMLMRPLMRFYLDTWRKTAGYTPAIKNKDCLPDLRGMIDNKIYDMLGLTKDEIQIIIDHYNEYPDMERVL